MGQCYHHIGTSQLTAKSTLPSQHSLQNRATTKIPCPIANHRNSPKQNFPLINLSVLKYKFVIRYKLNKTPFTVIAKLSYREKKFFWT